MRIINFLRKVKYEMKNSVDSYSLYPEISIQTYT